MGHVSFLCIYHSISKVVLEEALLCIDWQIENAAWVGSFDFCLMQNSLLNNSGIDLDPTIMYVILFKIKKTFFVVQMSQEKNWLKYVRIKKVSTLIQAYIQHMFYYTTRLAIVHTHRLLEGKKFWKFNWVHFAH